mgnify:CR=1 FL=1
MKGSKYFWLILFLSILPMLPIILNPLLIHTHDGLVHLPRMGAWFKALKDGQIPPRWAADLNYGYGTPVLIFMYPWPYFLSTLFLSLGLGLVWSFKLVLTLSFVFAAVLMFIFSRTFFKDEKKAFLVTMLYQFASFHLIEINARGALGEVWTYTFVPLAMLGLTKIFRAKKMSGFFLSALGTGLLILSHNSISLSFFAVLVLFVLLFGKNLLDYFWGFLSLGLGLGLSVSYWLPALWERKYTYGDLFMKDLYLEHFPTLKQLFWPNLFNQSFGQVHHIPVQIGLIHGLSLAVALYLLVKKKLSRVEKRVVIFSWLVFLTGFFLMQPFSAPIWAKFALLRQFQFSWRFLALVVLAPSLTGFVFKKAFWLLVCLIFLLSLVYWRAPEGFDQLNEADYWHYPLNTTYFGEADTIWAANPPSQYPEKRIEIIEGEGTVKTLEKTSVLHRLELSAQTSVNILDRTHFFPGWRVFIADDGKPTSGWNEIPIQFQDANHRGLITFAVPQGEHQIEVRFGRTKDRLIAESISLISFGFLAIGLGSLLYFKRR